MESLQDSIGSVPVHVLETVQKQLLNDAPVVNVDIPRLMAREDVYPEGDTQLMDTQIYRELSGSMRKTELAPATVTQGETGYVDLTSGWPPASPPLSDIGSLGSSQDGAELPKEPKTPAIATHKRNESVDLPSAKTPHFSQAFGITSRAPLLTATQLFNQTQAVSSPVTDNPRSDPIVSRPSPNLRNDDHFNQISPGATIATPTQWRSLKQSSSTGKNPLPNRKGKNQKKKPRQRTT
ncbi:hypothetical protein K470DRAFT_251014, partial [Piedraia hortae CBS 480.64]